jgi:uncharacterized protein
MQRGIIFTSDLHGNPGQYKRLVDYCKKTEPYALIIGGDIAPKGGSDNLIEDQRKFLEELKGIFKPIESVKIYLMMGNDDCKCNLDVLERLKNEGCFSMINEKRTSLDTGFDIIGYPYVPITPFGLKDWEKFDLTSVPKSLEKEYLSRLKDCRFNGVKTSDGRWESFGFFKGLEKEDSIELDLKKDLFTKNPEKTIYVFHSPPFKTDLDLTYSMKHVGSFAMRSFIETYQPYLTLHGHIHETVDVSHKFITEMGKTLSASSGNHNVGRLFLLEFDLKDLSTIKRMQV